MIPDQLEKRLEVLSKKLMPSEGEADTLEGEMIRAVNRIAYRYYNDGDVWYSGYGCETAGPCVEFLCDAKVCPLASEMFKTITCVQNEAYEQMLCKMIEQVVEYVEGKNGQYTENVDRIDMLSYDSRYKEDNEDDDYYYDEEDEEIEDDCRLD